MMYTVNPQKRTNIWILDYAILPTKSAKFQLFYHGEFMQISQRKRLVLEAKRASNSSHM